ncbi:hypothetical protein AB0G05_45065 [Nonomuraea wenchangensis]
MRTDEQSWKLRSVAGVSEIEQGGEVVVRGEAAHDNRELAASARVVSDHPGRAAPAWWRRSQITDTANSARAERSSHEKRPRRSPRRDADAPANAPRPTYTDDRDNEPVSEAGGNRL